jgi:hypothetical protein
MCPACIATAALLAASVTSAGGLGAMVVKKLRAKADAKDANPNLRTTGGKDEPSNDRVAR